MATAEEEKNKKKKPQQEQPNKTPSKAGGQPLPRAEAPKNLPKNMAFNRMPARGFWETAVDSADEMFSLSGEGVNALLGRGLSRTLNDRVPDSAFAYNPRKDNGSYTFTPAQIGTQAAAKRDELYGTGGIKAERDRRAFRAADEYAEDPSKWGQGKRLAGELVGGTIGDANPTYMITGPAALTNRLAAKGVPLLFSKPLSNIITQGALGGATDAAVQGGEIGEGIKDEFSWGRLGLNIAAGMAFQGVGEGLGPLARMLGGKLMPPERGLPETHRGIYSDSPLAEYTQQKADALEEITPEEVFRLAEENKTPLLDMDDNPIPFNKKMAEDWANEHNTVVKAQREQGGRGLDGFDGKPVEAPKQPSVIENYKDPNDIVVTGNKKRTVTHSPPRPVRDPGVTPEPTKRELVRAERVKRQKELTLEKGRVWDSFKAASEDPTKSPKQRAQATNELAEVHAEFDLAAKKYVANIDDAELKSLYDHPATRTDSDDPFVGRVIEEYNKRQEPPVVLDDVLTKLTDVLKGTKKTSAEQRENVSRFRKEQYRKLAEAQRYSTGAAGLAQEKAALKGQADQAITGDIRGKFSAKEIDVLHNALKNSESLSKSPYDKVNARDALDKILDEGIPTAREIGLIERAIRSASATPVKPSTAKVVPIKFMRDGKRVKLNVEDLTEKELAKALRQNTRPGATVVNQFTVNELVSTLRGKRNTTDKVIEFMENLINVPRSAVSTADLSAPLRQGVFMAGRKEFYGALPGMFKEFAENFKNHDEFIVSDMNANWKPSTSQVLDDIRQMPRYDEMMEVELAITDPHSKVAANREESFQTPWVEKVPLIGRVAKASNAAYSAFLNKLRADSYNSIVSKAEATRELSAKEKRDIARYINSATGRGDLKYFDDKVEFLQRGAGILNATLFSPRLMQARVNLLNPVFYKGLSPVARKEAFKDLAKFSTIAGSVLTLAALAGADIETDARSSDFMKIKTGNTRYDILGGFGQYLVLATRAAMGQTKTGRGDIKELDGKGNNDTFGDVALRFGRSKLAPVPAYVINSMLKENVIGEETGWTKGALQMMFPLFVQGLADAYKEEGWGGVAKTTPSLFGVGVTTYDEGLDRFGRDPTSKEETDPTVLALEELAPDGMDSLLGYLDKGDLELFDATEEDVKAYQELSGKLTLEYMAKLIKTPEWVGMTNEEKLKETKDVIDDMRLYAREDLFPNYYAPEDDLPPEDPEDEALIEDVPPEEEEVDAPVGEGGYQSGIKANTVSPYVLTIFPDAIITSTSRGANHPLTKKNPGSSHYQDGQFTVDIKPIPGWTYKEAVKEFNRQGLEVAYSKNETGNGKVDWATGDHWHFEFVGWEE